MSHPSAMGANSPAGIWKVGPGIAKCMSGLIHVVSKIHHPDPTTFSEDTKAAKIIRGDLESPAGQRLLKEYQVYCRLAAKAPTAQGFCRVHFFGTAEYPRAVVLVLDLLSTTLHVERLAHPFSDEEILKIAGEMIERIRVLHDLGLIHGCIEPSNIGTGTFHHRFAFCFGFGDCARYLDTNGQHMPGDKGSPMGTVRFAAIRAHKGRTLSRSNDIESLVYALLSLRAKPLLWDTIDQGGEKSYADKVLDLKESHSVADICDGAPPSLAKMLGYVYASGETDKPDYEMLQKFIEDDKPTYANIEINEEP